MKVFAVRDGALSEFMNPFFCPSAGVALRAFSDECNNDTSPFHVHPEDYELFELGEFVTESGVFLTHEPRSICRAVSFKR